jgi:hypothetical protein
LQLPSGGASYKPIIDGIRSLSLLTLAVRAACVLFLLAAAFALAPPQGVRPLPAAFAHLRSFVHLRNFAANRRNRTSETRTAKFATSI